MTSITLAEAERILSAAKTKVLEMGTHMAVSVVDPRGDLVAMFRADRASWRTPPISRAKALAAACFGRPGGEMAADSQAPFIRGLMEMERGHMIPGPGGFPIFRGGELIGAVGASSSGPAGGPAADEDVARGALEATGFSMSP